MESPARRSSCETSAKQMPIRPRQWEDLLLGCRLSETKTFFIPYRFRRDTTGSVLNALDTPYIVRADQTKKPRLQPWLIRPTRLQTEKGRSGKINSSRLRSCHDLIWFSLVFCNSRPLGKEINHGKSEENQRADLPQSGICRSENFEQPKKHCCSKICRSFRIDSGSKQGKVEVIHFAP